MGCSAIKRLHSFEWSGDKWMLNWKGCVRNGRGLILRHYPSICYEGLKETTKNLSQDNLYPGWDLNPEPSKYDTWLLKNHSTSTFSPMVYSNEFLNLIHRPVFKTHLFGNRIFPFLVMRQGISTPFGPLERALVVFPFLFLHVQPILLLDFTALMIAAT
jgi:hypothetical protein